jgi:hypothetical protein
MDARVIYPITGHYALIIINKFYTVNNCEVRAVKRLNSPEISVKIFELKNQDRK